MNELRYWMWKLFFMVPVGLVYYAVASDGLRVTLPTAFAVKLERLPLPFVHLLADDEFGHKLDIASVLSVILVVGVCYVWERLIEILILNETTLAESQPHTHSDRKRFFLMLLGPVLLFADAALFFLGVQKHTSWSASAGGVLPALVATVLYVALIVTAAFVTTEARHHVDPPGGSP